MSLGNLRHNANSEATTSKSTIDQPLKCAIITFLSTAVNMRSQISEPSLIHLLPNTYKVKINYSTPELIAVEYSANIG
jgi:hypothetical protein